MPRDAVSQTANVERTVRHREEKALAESRQQIDSNLREVDAIRAQISDMDTNGLVFTNTHCDICSKVGIWNKSASLRYFDTCFMHNMGGVSDRRWQDSRFMYYKTKKSASLRYFYTCFMHNIGGVPDRR